ncbi:MAG: LuxR family transcriptional regulator [Bacteroidales bacterium]|nr:LuxR family transcriptional regulator [Bacteroidales bacterium]
MKRFVLCLCLCSLAASTTWAYNDHRNHNIDSLELAVSTWTPDRVAKASTQELIDLDNAYRELMIAFSNLSGDKCEFYARKSLTISVPHGWEYAKGDAYRYIGLRFYGKEQWDSAHFYYNLALEALYKMEAGATSPTAPDGYPQREIDDIKSALYGTIGNIYNMQDSLELAMDYYAKAAEIFDKWGWNESNSILYYNIGETWVEEADYDKAMDGYRKALDYADAASDSLLMANVWKGMGRVYLETGRYSRAMRYLKKAEAYYTAHVGEEEDFHQENLESISRVLDAQKKVSFLALGAMCVAVLVAAGIAIGLRRKRKSASDSAHSKANGVKLNDRELEIIRLIAQGKTTAQIADEICLSAETVKWYRKKLFTKFEASNAAELIRRVTEEGII